MNPQRPSLSISPRSLRTRFAIRFLRALRKIRDRKCTLPSSNRLGATATRRIKTAADASMAYVVGPRRAWSRAVLLKMRWRRSRSIRVRAPVMIAGGKRVRKRKMRGVRERRKINQLSPLGQEEQLRKLVPGSELMDAYSLLDETAHYIKCLNAQVMVMRNIVNYCST